MIATEPKTASTAAGHFWERHFGVCGAAILTLALFNLTFRLDREFVTDWDESLYGLTAWEALTNGSWIGTTYMGTLDYYNTKPPLMVWLIALSFKAFGVSLMSLRIASALSAWATVAILLAWTKRAFGELESLIASLVLATTFGFVYVHSGRNAATDAPFTLLMVLTVVILWIEERQPRMRLWVGPILAAVFLLRGFAVLMPIALVATVTRMRAPTQRRWTPLFLAGGLFLVPVSAWLLLRHAIDRWVFMQHMFVYDFIARTVQPIEEHSGNFLSYVILLVKHHYDWLIAGVVALLLFPAAWRSRCRTTASWRRPNDSRVLLAAWAFVTFVIPTVMQTKVPWYLNPFYPVFAVALGLSLGHALKSTGGPRWRTNMTAAAFLLALVIAEGKLLWYSYHYRDVAFSGQFLLLEERGLLREQRVYLEGFARADHFVAEAIVGARARHIHDRAAFLRDVRPGDFLLSSKTLRSSAHGARSHEWPAVPVPAGISAGSRAK